MTLSFSKITQYFLYKTFVYSNFINIYAFMFIENNASINIMSNIKYNFNDMIIVNIFFIIELI
jgi:hypothetical protein